MSIPGIVPRSPITVFAGIHPRDTDAAVVNRGIESFGNDYVKGDWGIARLTTTISANMTNEIAISTAGTSSFRRTVFDFR